MSPTSFLQEVHEPVQLSRKYIAPVYDRLCGTYSTAHQLPGILFIYLVASFIVMQLDNEPDPFRST